MVFVAAVQIFKIKNNIDKKRAVFNSLTKGIKLSQVENGFSSSTKVLEVIDWGVKYGNKDVTIKRYSVKGKYRTGVWVKGKRGIVSSEKFKKVSENKIDSLVFENNLNYDSEIWNNKF